MKAIGAAGVLVAERICTRLQDVEESEFCVLAFYGQYVIMPTYGATDCQNPRSTGGNEPSNRLTHTLSLPKIIIL